MIQTDFRCPQTHESHRWDNTYKCADCGQNEADWWFEHFEAIQHELVPVESELPDSSANPYFQAQETPVQAPDFTLRPQSSL